MKLLPTERALASLIWLEFLRSRLWLVSVGFVVLLMGVGWFSQTVSVAGGEHNQLVILSQLLRLGFICTITSYVLASLSGNQQTQLIHQQLALPITQARYMAVYMAAYGTVAMALSCIWAFPVFILSVPAMALGWAIGLMCEGLLMSLCAVIFALGFSQFTLAWLALMLFYVFARVWPTLLLLAQTPYIPDSNDIYWTQFIHLLGYITPRLDVFASSDWLVTVNHEKPNLMLQVIQTLVFAPLLYLVSLFDLRKKEWA